MIRARRACVLLALVAAVAVPSAVSGPSASAHQRADLSFESPDDGQVVSGESVLVVVAAAGGELGQVDFTMQLDGQPVATSGAVGEGSLFTTFSLRSGEQARVRVATPEPGDHELRLVYGRDGDDPKPDVVRRFRTSSGRDGYSAVPVLVALGVSAVVLNSMLFLRRRRRSVS